MVDVFRRVVQLHNEQALTSDGALDGLRLPSHDELVKAVENCRWAEAAGAAPVRRARADVGRRRR